MVFILIGIGIILLLVLVFYIINKRIESKVLSFSEKIKEINKINNTFSFNNINYNIHVKKHYDNKGHYNRIEPAFVMSAYLKDNIVEFSKTIDGVKANRLLYEEYKDRVMMVVSRPRQQNLEVIKLPNKLFLRKEKKLIKSILLKPVLDLKFNVHMSYRSPKGQVNISKNDTFDYNQVFSSFESISRTYLDRETYEKLMLVERGEVSDSLRYDILNGDNFRCVICGASAKEGVRLHVDHIIPVSKGGKSNVDNLRTLCERCNVGKSDKIET